MEALRKKEISANKASKVYKIPSSTLYKIARKEGIELAQPFNAVATAWNQVSKRGLKWERRRGMRCSVLQDDLNTALEAIRGGMPVQKAAAEFGKNMNQHPTHSFTNYYSYQGIPSGTLYGRCKKVGIELSKNAQVILEMV